MKTEEDVLEKYCQFDFGHCHSHCVHRSRWRPHINWFFSLVLLRSNLADVSFGLWYLLVVISPVGLAIRCWNCNSKFNSGCADPFNNSTIGYLTECLPTISLPNIQTVTQCRKIKHKGKQSTLSDYRKWRRRRQRRRQQYTRDAEFRLFCFFYFHSYLPLKILENGIWSYIRGCNTNDQLNLYEATVYSCNYDGCNGANSNGPLAALALLATPVVLLLRLTNLL